MTDVDATAASRETRRRLASSSSHTAPSGATATSRMRWPTRHRSAGVAPPLPSKTTRVSVCDAIPPIRAEPFHCGKHRTVVEREVARRDDRVPVDHRLRQIRPRVGTRDRHTVVVVRIRDERPAVVLARLDQIQLVAAAGSVLELPTGARLARTRVRTACDGRCSRSPTASGSAPRTCRCSRRPRSWRPRCSAADR